MKRTDVDVRNAQGSSNSAISATSNEARRRMKWRAMGLNVSGLEDHFKPDAHFGLVLLCMYPIESQMNGSRSKNFSYIGTYDIIENMIWQVGMSSLRAPESEWPIS